MMQLHRIQVALLAGFVLGTTSFADATELSWSESPEGVLITEGDDKVLFYQRAEKSKEGNYARAHYVHPLYDLDGTVLTEDFPDDHRHHRGIFWAWHQLHVAEERVGDGWALRHFRWDVRKVTPSRNDDGSISLKLEVDWKSSDWRGGGEPVVVENSTIRVYPKDGTQRRVDFDVRILAVNEQTFVGGSEDVKGYGGFSVRLKLPKDIRFTSQNGAEKSVKTAVPASPWMVHEWVTGKFWIGRINGRQLDRALSPKNGRISAKVDFAFTEKHAEPGVAGKRTGRALHEKTGCASLSACDPSRCGFVGPDRTMAPRVRPGTLVLYSKWKSGFWGSTPLPNRYGR